MNKSVRFASALILSLVPASCAADANDAAGSTAAEESASSSGANEGNFISGILQEWKVSVSPNAATAGEANAALAGSNVSFNVYGVELT